MKKLFNRATKSVLTLAMMMALATGFACPVTASSQKFGDYTVHFSVFNSTFITPDVAKIYQLTRAGDRALVNISVTKTIDGKISLGLPAKVSGAATNLIQQQRPLEFQTISEGDATYYLAELRHTNEEVTNFVIELQVDSSATPFNVRFTRNLHTEK